MKIVKVVLLNQVRFQIKKEDKLIFEEFKDENSDDDEKENVGTYEGYLIKVVEKKMRKIWFKLVGKDLFFFTNIKDELHKGMHHLSGVFIQEEKGKIFNGKKYFCLSMIYPKKTRLYYCEDEKEYKIWIEKLKIATEYTNLNDLYEDCLKDAKPRLEAIKDDITGPVYNYFKGYVDLELAESGEEVDVFSWMNCSVFGRDLNATLNIMKRHFKKDLQNIFIITLVNNGVIIVEMILITFILNWYKYDPLENNPVGEMEINEKKIGDNEKDKEKVEYEEEEDEDEDEEEIDEETDNDFHKNSMSLTNDENKKKNEMDSPKRIEINKGIKNNLIDNNKYLPSESSSSEDNFKLKMSQKLNKEDDKNGN